MKTDSSGAAISFKSVAHRLHFMDLMPGQSAAPTTLRVYFDRSMTAQETTAAQTFLATQMERLGASTVGDATLAHDTCWTQISLTFKTHAGQEATDLLRRMVQFVESQKHETGKARNAAALVAQQPSTAAPKLETIL